MLYEPDQFDRLIDEPWVPARVEDAIAAIVADADAAFGLDTLWAPADYWDEYRDNQPPKVLHTGAAGVCWSLAALRRRGHAQTSLDLAAVAARALELERALPDAAEDERYRPGSLLHGEAGPLLVCFLLSSDPQLADELYELVHDNVANPRDDIGWGAPGTLLAALAMHERTGEVRWLEAASESALAVRARRGDDGLWSQGSITGAAGNTLALRRFEPDDGLARETSAVLTRHAFREDGLANWPGSPRAELARPSDGRICVQQCHGAPGVLARAWDYLDEDLLLAGAELVWQAGAHKDEKGHGLCHGTSGNGFALLKAFARTGDELWLQRARAFAVHALAQADRIATTNGRRRYSLFNGDPGTALFAAACLDVDVRFPIIDLI